jgi:hypothetical protein
MEEYVEFASLALHTGGHEAQISFRTIGIEEVVTGKTAIEIW